MTAEKSPLDLWIEQKYPHGEYSYKEVVSVARETAEWLARELITNSDEQMAVEMLRTKDGGHLGSLARGAMEGHIHVLEKITELTGIKDPHD